MVLVAVSAGGECEEHAQQLWRESKPDEYFFMEIFGSAVVEHLVTVISGRICGWADRHGAAALPHYSPGYSGWDISDQIKLWNLLRQNGIQHFDSRLEVLESGMLGPGTRCWPSWASRAVWKRRGASPDASFRSLLVAQVPVSPRVLPARTTANRRRAHVAAARVGEFNEINQLPVLNTGAQYTLNAWALEKWSRERLRLELSRDGGLEAGFRYEGTTCSNLGQRRWNTIIV